MCAWQAVGRAPAHSPLTLLVTGTGVKTTQDYLLVAEAMVQACGGWVQRGQNGIPYREGEGQVVAMESSCLDREPDLHPDTVLITDLLCCDFLICCDIC